MAVGEHVVTSTIRHSEEPSEDNRKEIVLQAAVVVTCVLLAVLVVYQTAGRVPDDAYILLRYVQNLLDGHGWVYNLQSPTTNAVSAPLYTLALALLSLVVGSVESAMTLLFVFTTAASGYLAFALLHRNSMTLGGLSAMCLMIVNPWLLATQGLETSAFVCLLLLSVLFLGAGKNAAAGFVLVAATLVRGDGAVLAAVVFVLLWAQSKRFPWRLTIGAAGATILWAVTAIIIAVPIIPDTLAAKYAQGRSGLWGDLLYSRGFILTPEVFGFMGWAATAALLAGAGLLLVGGLHGLRQYLGPFILSVVLVFAVYGLIIRPPSYHWYYGPQIALMALCGGVTIATLARAAAENIIQESAVKQSWMSGNWLGPLRLTSHRARAAALSIAILATATISAVGWRDIQSGPDRPAYLEASAWLRDNTPDDATVALTEIGVVGWYSNREMVDFLGLLSRESVEEIAKGDSTSWLSREEPDYWIVHQPQWSGMEAASGEPWFALAYQPVWTNGELVAWSRYRSIADAKKLLAITVAPLASRIADELQVPTADSTTRQSIMSLVALLSVRDDVRETYTRGNRLDLAGLIGWTIGATGRADPHGAAVHQFERTYRKIATNTNVSNVEIPPRIR